LDSTGTVVPSKSGNPLITLITNQGHKFPAEAPPLIVKFFKEQAMAERL
jgi:hypothetical protein